MANGFQSPGFNRGETGIAGFLSGILQGAVTGLQLRRQRQLDEDQQTQTAFENKLRTDRAAQLAAQEERAAQTFLQEDIQRRQADLAQRPIREGVQVTQQLQDVGGVSIPPRTTGEQTAFTRAGLKEAAEARQPPSIPKPAKPVPFSQTPRGVAKSTASAFKTLGVIDSEPLINLQSELGETIGGRVSVFMSGDNSTGEEVDERTALANIRAGDAKTLALQDSQLAPLMQQVDPTEEIFNPDELNELAKRIDPNKPNVFSQEGGVNLDEILLRLAEERFTKEQIFQYLILLFQTLPAEAEQQRRGEDIERSREQEQQILESQFIKPPIRG